MAIPILAAAPAILQGLGGLGQAIFGGGRAKRAQRELDRLQNPVYEQSKAIGDYYTKALNRYSANPYQSNMYRAHERNAQRGFSTGINALQDRRSGLAGISKLMQGYNDSMLNAGAAAEQQQAQALGQLGQAASAQQGEDRMSFQVNKMLPFERKYNELSQKAGAGAQTFNAGLSNLFGSASTLGQMAFDDHMAKKYYGK
jgi:hypothetical protein